MRIKPGEGGVLERRDRRVRREQTEPDSGLKRAGFSEMACDVLGNCGSG